MSKNQLFKTGVPGLIFLLVILSSCRSHKELIYYRDANGRDQVALPPKGMPVYRLHPKDNLYVSIISANPDLNRVYNPVQAGSSLNQNNQYENQANQFVNGYELDAQGNIQLPIIGKINLEGKTVAESEKAILTQSTAYLKDITVKVKLLNFRVTVLGEVKLPGVYYNYNNSSFSITDAIAMANGNTDFADLSAAMVIRPNDSGSQIYTLNLNNKAAMSSEGFYLQPNDQVILQPARNKNTQIQISTAALVLSTVTSIFLILNYIKK
jgi:polysaccharide export outer membrane protein